MRWTAFCTFKKLCNLVILWEEWRRHVDRWPWCILTSLVVATLYFCCSCDGLMRTDAATLDPSILSFKLTAASEDQKHQEPRDRPQQLTADKKVHESIPKPLVLALPAPAWIKQVYLFEVHSDKVGESKESALTEPKRPLVSEYDFAGIIKTLLSILH